VVQRAPAARIHNLGCHYHGVYLGAGGSTSRGDGGLDGPQENAGR